LRTRRKDEKEKKKKKKRVIGSALFFFFSCFALIWSADTAQSPGFRTVLFDVVLGVFYFQ
jgi:hypothetical protein